MQQEDLNSQARDTVVIIGGKGGLYARYREAVERNGYHFRGYEAHIPTKSGPTGARIALVIVMVTMVSHPLMTRARALAGDPERVVYLRSPSLSAVRQTVEAAARGLSNLQHRGAA
jgi:hypothetical protein